MDDSAPAVREQRPQDLLRRPAPAGAAEAGSSGAGGCGVRGDVLGRVAHVSG